MPTVLITGANRGIGLEHVRQALATGDRVIACCRAPDAAKPLQALQAQHGGDALVLETLDVSDGESVAALARRMAGLPIDVLVNNAGLYSTAPWPEGARLQSLEGMDYALWGDILRVNLMGPFRTVAALRPNVLAGTRKLIVMISSDLGSIADNKNGGGHAYRSSKAALNMIVRGLAAELRNDGIVVVSLAPGWTMTDLGGPDAQWTVEASVAAQRAVLARVAMADSGTFINLTGELLPW